MHVFLFQQDKFRGTTGRSFMQKKADVLNQGR